MPTMLPLALEALMRQQGRNVPNEQDVGMLGMPTGMPFSNQAPYTPSRAPMDGSLGMLSALISGLSGHAGPMQEAAPDPRTMVIRPMVSPGEAVNNPGGIPEAYGHMGGIGPSSGVDALLAQMQQRGAAMNVDPMAFRRPNSSGITNPDKYNEVYGPQGTYTQDQNARQDLVRQRAMQVAQARTNRQSGMDPRLAAILAAVGADSDLGGVALGDAVGGRGAGLKMREQNMNAADNQRALDIQEGKNSGASAAPDIKKAAATIYATKLEASRGDKTKAANEALIEVMKSGVTEAEAKAVIAEVAGIADKNITPAGQPQKKKPLLGAYGGLQREPEWGDVIGAAADSVGEAIRNWDFWKTGMM